MDYSKLAKNAELDQAMEATAVMARVAGAMYMAYIDSGIPPALAADLVRDWQYLHMRRSLWPDAPPPVRGDEI